MADTPSTTNLVALPTAARTKVRQPAPRQRRALGAALPQHPAEFVPYWVRERQRRAAEAPEQTPALIIAAALFAAAGRDQQTVAFGVVREIDRKSPSLATNHALQMMGIAFNAVELAKAAGAAHAAAPGS